MKRFFRPFIFFRPLMAVADESGGAAPSPAPAAPSPAPAAPAAPATAPTPATAAAPAPAAADDKGYWPGDWRQRAAKGDDKVLQRLGRYDSPQAVVDALVSAQNRINAGELKPVLGKEATPEQLAEWRAAHNIPDAPDKYDVSDLKAPEQDKPFIDKILAAAHATNQTPDQIKGTLKAYYDVRDLVESHVAEKDKAAQTKGEDALRQEWGPEYRLNSNLIANLLSGTASPELSEALMNGRLADGGLIKNDPAVQRFLLSLALIQNPTGTVVPGGGNPAQGIREELAKIDKFMVEHRDAYFKDEPMQSRKRNLIDAAMRAGIMDPQGNWKAS